MSSAAGVAILVGITIALVGEWLLALVAGLWQRRPRTIAIAAILGLAVGDAIYVWLGSWLGAQLATVLTDDGFRSTVAAGLLIGVGAKVAVGLLIGPHGVPGDAVLPTRPLATWARFAAIGILWPIPAIVCGAVVFARPSLLAPDVSLAYAATTVASILAARILWAASGRVRRPRSTRAIHNGLGLVTILLLALLALRGPI